MSKKVSNPAPPDEARRPAPPPAPPAVHASGQHPAARGAAFMSRLSDLCHEFEAEILCSSDGACIVIEIDEIEVFRGQCFDGLLVPYDEHG